MKNIIDDFKNITCLFVFTLIYSCIFSGHFSMENGISILLFFNFSIYICGALITYRFNLDNIDSFHKNLILAFLAIGIIAFSYIFTLKMGIDKIYYVNKLTRMNIIFSIYESICLFLAVNYYKVNINYRKAILITISISFFVSYLCSNSGVKSFLEEENIYTAIFQTLRIASILLKASILRKLYKIKSDISSRMYYYLSVFLILRIIMHILSFFYLIYISFINIMVNFIIEYMAHYCILKIMIYEIIKNPYINIYNDLVKKTRELEEVFGKLSEICEEKKVLSINYEKIKRDEEIKNELLTNISHEFKTPINVIYSAIQTQELLGGGGDVNSILKYNPVIKKNCNRLIRLINNFIDITKLKNSTTKIKLEYFNIVDLTENIIESVIPFARSKNLDIIFDTSSEELSVKINEQLFDRLILNLLSNAIKYSKETGNIYVTLSSSSNEAQIVIEDEGIGMSKENLKVIFNRFVRVDETFSRNTEGSGLGLNIVKEILDIFKGKIEVNSKLGHGTKVKIILPMAHFSSEMCNEKIHKNSYSNVNHKREVEIELSDIYL